MAYARILRAGLVSVLGMGASSASAGDFYGMWNMGGGGGEAGAYWSSDLGQDITASWGLAPYAGPYTGPYSCTASRDFGNGGQPGGIGLVSATISAILPPAQPTPTTIPLHIVFDDIQQNGSGYGIGCGGGVTLYASVTGPMLYYRINWTATYTGSMYTGIVPQGMISLSDGMTIVGGLYPPGTTLSGVTFGNNASKTITLAGELQQGRDDPGHGHYVMVADVYFSDAPFPPDAPGLASPGDGSADQGTEPTLTWTSAPGATTYTVNIADNAGLSNPIHTAAGLTGTSYTVPASVLQGCTEYYWGVTAVSVNGSTPSIPAAFALTTAPTAALTAALAGDTPGITCPSGEIPATVLATGDGVLSYQWQALLPSIGWIDLVEGSNPWNNGAGAAFDASGANADSVTITGLADAPEDFPFPAGMRLRCVVANACGSVTSDVASVSVCPADYDCNGFPNGDDFDLFMEDFYYGNLAADVDGNTFVNGDDFDYFLERFFYGC